MPDDFLPPEPESTYALIPVHRDYVLTETR